MGKLRRLTKETTHLQSVLATKNTRIGELETQLIKLTERNAVLASTNEDLKNMKEKP